jgi:hypothetical protein
MTDNGDCGVRVDYLEEQTCSKKQGSASFTKMANGNNQNDNDHEVISRPDRTTMGSERIGKGFEDWNKRIFKERSPPNAWAICH